MCGPARVCNANHVIIVSVHAASEVMTVQRFLTHMAGAFALRMSMESLCDSTLANLDVTI